MRNLCRCWTFLHNLKYIYYLMNYNCMYSTLRCQLPAPVSSREEVQRSDGTGGYRALHLAASVLGNCLQPAGLQAASHDGTY